MAAQMGFGCAQYEIARGGKLRSEKHIFFAMVSTNAREGLGEVVQLVLTCLFDVLKLGLQKFSQI